MYEMIGYPNERVFQFAWFVGVIVGAIVLSILLRPLDPSGTSKKSRWPEMVLLVVGGVFFFSLFVSELVEELYLAEEFDVVWLIFLFILYAVSIVFFPVSILWLILRVPSMSPEFVTLKYSYSLSELIAMVGAIGFFPMMISSFSSESLETSATNILRVALVSGLVFCAALHRLNSNHIPHGITRTSFLMLCPYMICACLYFFTRSSMLIMSCSRDTYRIHLKVNQTQIFKLVVAASIVCLGAFLARKAKSEARPVVEEMQTASLKEEAGV